MIRPMLKWVDSVTGRAVQLQRPWLENIDLENLIDKRSREKRECIRDKVRQDLLTIREKKNKNASVEPFPPGSFEVLQANDFWEKVFKYLTEPVDVTSAYFACPIFWKILENQRKLTLLPEVVKILLNEEKSGRRTPKQLEFLPLRVASKPWKKIVEQEVFERSFLGDSWHTNLQEFEDWDEYGTRADFCSFTWESEMEKGSLDTLVSLQELSFPSRKVRVRYDPAEPELFDRAQEFLDWNGDSVWLLFYMGNEEMEDYDRLCQVLRKELVDFREHLCQNPFPALETLNFLHCDSSVDPLLKEICITCGNLKSVSEGHSPDMVEGEILPDTDSVSLLPRLTLDLYGSLYPETLFFTRVTWPLKVLDIPWCSHDMQTNCSLWWPVLNRFRETLEYLTLPDITKDNPFVPLLLIRLKELTIECDRRVSGQRNSTKIGFDDLLHLKALEKLFIWDYSEPRFKFQSKDEKALVKVASFLGKMEFSNIWHCFPYLTELKFNHGVWGLHFVREGSTLSCYEKGRDPPTMPPWELIRVSRIQESGSGFAEGQGLRISP